MILGGFLWLDRVPTGSVLRSCGVGTGFGGFEIEIAGVLMGFDGVGREFEWLSMLVRREWWLVAFLVSVEFIECSRL